MGFNHGVNLDGIDVEKIDIEATTEQVLTKREKDYLFVDPETFPKKAGELIDGVPFFLINATKALKAKIIYKN